MSERPSEFELIARYFAPLAGEGAFGLLDDAATICPAPDCDLVLTKDMLVAGVHFFADDAPDLVARKALRVNLSDLAAKGARPKGFMLGLGLPTDWQPDWLAAFAKGLGEDRREYQCPLLGGDTVKTPGPVTISITAFGEVPAGRMVPRTTAQAGDAIFVTGTIGDSALGLRARLEPEAIWLKHLPKEHQDHLTKRYLLPEPRSVFASAVQRHARAAMDISDGFVGDLRKMMAHVGATIELAAIPLSAAARAAIEFAPALREVALTGGDDYELLMAVPQAAIEPLMIEARHLGQALTRVGTVTGERDVIFVDGEGKHCSFSQGSFVHF